MAQSVTVKNLYVVSRCILSQEREELVGGPHPKKIKNPAQPCGAWGMF